MCSIIPIGWFFIQYSSLSHFVGNLIHPFLIIFLTLLNGSDFMGKSLLFFLEVYFIIRIARSHSSLSVVCLVPQIGLLAVKLPVGFSFSMRTFCNVCEFGSSKIAHRKYTGPDIPTLHPLLRSTFLIIHSFVRI